MSRNVGRFDRVLRAAAGVGMGVGAWFVTWPLAVAFAGTGVYLLFTSVAGTCFGYRLMGRSTCPLETHG